VVLETLNRDLVRQELPNCQFVTGLYGTINTRTHELVYARGGHPHPIHVSAEGQCVESRVIGGLLGIFDEEEFGYTRLTLEPGQKFIVYSDGIEDLILCRRQRDAGPTAFKADFLNLVHQPADECISSMTARLDQEEGSLTQLDDQTCLIIERLAP
jgi:sigma-B regulation protein RsbU (phosphoserine phosphatase)